MRRTRRTTQDYEVIAKMRTHMASIESSLEIKCAILPTKKAKMMDDSIIAHMTKIRSSKVSGVMSPYPTDVICRRKSIPIEVEGGTKATTED